MSFSQSTQLQDRLTGALIGLARCTDGNEHLISSSSTAVIIEGLFATRPHGNTDKAALETLLRRAEEEKRRMVPDCFACASPCGRTSDYDMNKLQNAGENIRSLKCRILSDIRDAAAYAHQAAVLGHHEEGADRLFYQTLIAIGMDDFGAEDLLPIALELRDYLEMLDRA